MLDSPDGSTDSNEDWEIGDCLAQWWRPHFETFLVRCVRLLSGLTRCSIRTSPRTLPSRKSASCSTWSSSASGVRGPRSASSDSAGVFSVPRNMNLIAIPLFELCEWRHLTSPADVADDNAVRYGPHLAAIPHQLSRYQFILA